MELNDTFATSTDSGIINSAPGLYILSGEIGDNIYDSDDVDLYSADLSANTSLVLDVDADENGSYLDSVLRVFGPDETQIAVSDDDPAPDEPYTLDSFLDLTTGAAGQYHFGVSSYSNFYYDPNVAGSGYGYNTGEYDLNVRITNNITTNNGSNTIQGTSGLDFIRSLGGNDTVNAGDGDDIVNAGANSDLVNGGNGNDFLFGSLGTDTMSGGEGNDTLNGAEQRDLQFGDRGDDVLVGQQGADTLDGGRGHDSLLGGTGNDSLIGGFGADTIDGGDGSDRVNGNAGNDLIFGDTGSDILLGGSGHDTVSGGTGDDLVVGNLGNDILNGNNGADTLQGHSGSDRLNGGAEDDVLVGGAGDDILTGGSGQDTMTGGEGHDVFVYQNNRHGVDVITDFEIGSDVLDFGALVDSSQFSSATPFDDYIQLIQTGTGTTVRFDAGGDHAANQFVAVTKLGDIVASDLSATDFQFS